MLLMNPLDHPVVLTAPKRLTPILGIAPAYPVRHVSRRCHGTRRHRRFWLTSEIIMIHCEIRPKLDFRL
jgi:hypothetical protein